MGRETVSKIDIRVVADQQKVDIMGILVAEETTPVKSNKEIKLLCVLISTSSFLWGYCIGVFNSCFSHGAKGDITKDIVITTDAQALVTASLLMGGILSTAITYIPAEKYGRKAMLLVSDGLYILGALLCACANSVETLSVGRFVLGIAGGIITVIVPVYLAEVSPVEIRGQMGTLHTLQQTIGIFVSGLLGVTCVGGVNGGWRILFLFVVFPALGQLMLHTHLPGKQTLPFLCCFNKRKIYHAEELREIKSIGEETCAPPQPVIIERVTWTSLLSFKRSLMIGVVSRMCHILTGVNTIIFYPSRILVYGGVRNNILSTLSVSTTNVLATIIALKLIDQFGRKVLLTIGTQVLTVGIIALSMSLLCMSPWPSIQTVLTVAGALSYVAGAAMGLGSVTWVQLADLFPTTSLRLRALTIVVAVGHCCNCFIATNTFQIIDSLGKGDSPTKDGTGKLYIGFAFIASLALVFIYKVVPETKKGVQIVPHTVSLTTVVKPPSPSKLAKSIPFATTVELSNLKKNDSFSEESGLLFDVQEGLSQTELIIDVEKRSTESVQTL